MGALMNGHPRPVSDSQERNISPLECDGAVIVVAGMVA